MDDCPAWDALAAMAAKVLGHRGPGEGATQTSPMPERPTWRRAVAGGVLAGWSASDAERQGVNAGLNLRQGGQLIAAPVSGDVEAPAA